jgi:uncharacterized phage-associated protein
MATKDHPISLPFKLKAVLARLCERLGPITKTKAVKLPYLVDVVGNHLLGHRITEGTHETWDYGVVTREVYRAITHEDVSPDFVVEAHNFSEGGQLVKPGTASSSSLDEKEMRIVDEVARTFGRLDAGSLGFLTKALNTELSVDTWGSNQQASVNEDAFARLSKGWQSFARRLADLDLANRANWGDVIVDPSDYVQRALG